MVYGFRMSRNGLSRQDRAGSLGDTNSWGRPHRQRPRAEGSIGLSGLKQKQKLNYLKNEEAHKSARNTGVI